ncbi:MAG: MFS transporter [Woeseiaceae bacterium]|nr:MFS transporter [Woeseiaceae bacterium]
MTAEPDEPARDESALLPAEARAVGVIALIAMLRMFGLFAMLPVLALHAAGLEGATPLLIGIAVGGYGLTQAGLQIPLGALSDRIGRIPVILGGLALFAAGSVLAAVADSITMLVAGRLLQGAGAISATLTALLSDATREAVRTRSMAVLGIGIGAAFLVAIVAGPMLAARYDVPALFWIAAGLAGACALLLALLPAGIGRPAASGGSRLGPALRPDLLRLDAYVFLLHAILTANFVALPFLLTGRLELPVTSHWQVYVGALVASLLITVPLVLADDRQGRRATVSAAVGLVLAGELVLTFGAFGVWPVFLALVLFFGGFSFLEAGLPARLSLLARGDRRGASFGVFSSAQFLGAFAGGLLGGRFLAAGRPADVFFVCVLIAGLWLASMGSFRPKSGSPDPN